MEEMDCKKTQKLKNEQARIEKKRKKKAEKNEKAEKKTIKLSHRKLSDIPLLCESPILDTTVELSHVAR